jgi:PKD repeat protein
MGDTIFNGPGMDFKIIQAGTVAKAFTVSGSNSMDGPFTTIGIGNGTTSFDLNTVPLTKIRYLYIKDNGAGSSYGVGAGFNLDAVEMITQPLIVNFTASTISPCSGTSVNFTDISGGNPTSWAWSFPGGTPSSSTLQNPVNIHYDTPGTYNVSLTCSNGITTGSKTKTGFIVASISPVVNLGNDTTLCPWNTILLDAGNPGCTYLWSTGATSQTITVDSTGIGVGSRDFRVNITNSSGCTAKDTIGITFEICNDIKEIESRQDVTISPNPSDGYFSLEILGFEGGSWQLISVDGKIMAHSDIQLNHYTSTVDVREIPRGIYVLKVQKREAILIKKVYFR